LELELALAQQAEAEARKGRQAAEANSEQLREESEQLRELREESEQLREESEQLREELAKSRANGRTDHGGAPSARSVMVVGAITALGTVAGVMVAALVWSQKRPETIANNAAIEQDCHVALAADVLLKSKVDDCTELRKVSKAQATVPRPGLAEALAHLGNHSYLIVEGPRGCGKTTGVLLALSGKPGVLRVEMTSEADACVEIAKALRMPDARTMTLTMLEDVLLKANEAAKGARPTIVVEFARDPDREEYGKEQVSVLKKVCVDKGLANVVIVLSDADAAYAMPKDFARQKKIWVDDFTQVDAHTFLDKLGAPEPRDELFYQVGTRPMQLLRATEEGFTDYSAMELGEAEKDIRELIRLKGPTDDASGPAFKQLIIDLLENTSDGRSLQGFDDRAENLGLPSRSTDEYLASSRVVSKLYKKKLCHAVLYHRPSDTWRFHSTSHRRAAEREFPEAAARGAANRRAAESRPGSTWRSRVFG